MGMTRLIGAAVLLVGVAALLVVPFHPEAPALALLHGVTPNTAFARRVDWLLVESGGNFLVFALVGAAALAITRRPVVAALLGCALSAAAECAQLVIPNRVASWTDLLTNCLGAIAGVALTHLAARAMARRRDVRRANLA